MSPTSLDFINGRSKGTKGHPRDKLQVWWHPSELAICNSATNSTTAVRSLSQYYAPPKYGNTLDSLFWPEVSEEEELQTPSIVAKEVVDTVMSELDYEQFPIDLPEGVDSALKKGVHDTILEVCVKQVTRVVLASYVYFDIRSGTYESALLNSKDATSHQVISLVKSLMWDDAQDHKRLPVCENNRSD